MNMIFTKILTTPIGEMIAMATENGLCALEHCQALRQDLWKKRRQNYFPNCEDSNYSNQYIDAAELWIDAFFDKKWQMMPTVKLDMRGSAFEILVWTSLLEIPLGVTQSYKSLASKIGSPSGARAVGNACRRNSISLIIPCHRVIGVSAQLTGYAGGLGAKESLLVHEKNSG